MKIAAIAPSQVPSRTANSIQVMKTCSALAQIGHEVCLWVPGKGSSEWNNLSNQYGLSTEFKVQWIPSIRLLRKYDFSVKALSQAEKWGADVVYTWLPQVAEFALRRGTPALLEMHDLPTGAFGPGYFKRFAGHEGKKRLLVITDALRKRLEAFSGIQFSPREVAMAPNGVDFERFSNQPGARKARKQLGLPEQLTAVFSGHFYVGRGTSLLLELARRFPNIHFLWVGGRDEDVTSWRDRIKTEGLENITLTGFIPNQQLPLYLAAGDFLLMPYERSIAGSSGGNSVEICSPMKMFEYMATGRVILSSDLPVIHEVLNEKNAIFCTPEDVDSWASALESLVKNPGLRTRLARKAQTDARKYAWEQRAKTAMKGF
jgi:glycosyltransferase involved in cell wall biosynthesis